MRERPCYNCSTYGVVSVNVSMHPERTDYEDVPCPVCGGLGYTLRERIFTKDDVRAKAALKAALIAFREAEKIFKKAV